MIIAQKSTLALSIFIVTQAALLLDSIKFNLKNKILNSSNGGTSSVIKLLIVKLFSSLQLSWCTVYFSQVVTQLRAPILTH